MADTTDTSLDVADILAVDASVARSTGPGRYGITETGFAPKPFARIVAEKLALARELLGPELDLGPGSVVRKLIELSSLEDARTSAAHARQFDDGYVTTARGQALSLLGDELGLPRPWMEARGSVRLALTGQLPGDRSEIEVPRGARLLTDDGSGHAATTEPAVLSAASPERTVGVRAVVPGEAGQLDPAPVVDGTTPGRISALNPNDPKLADLLRARAESGDAFDVTVDHTAPLAGGTSRWPDDRYRELLLRAPRSIWRGEAIELVASLVPGVRQVVVRDDVGGLDLERSIFGNFTFIERLFATERDVASPYYLTVLIVPTEWAIWEGPGGLRAAVEAAIADVRPVGIFARVERAEEVAVGIAGSLLVQDVPLPDGDAAAVDGSDAGIALKRRVHQRVRRYVERLGMGEPVRAAEITWAVMTEPGVVDLVDLRILRYPPDAATVDLSWGVPVAGPEEIGGGENVVVQGNEIAVLVDDLDGLRVVSR